MLSCLRSLWAARCYQVITLKELWGGSLDFWILIYNRSHSHTQPYTHSVIYWAIYLIFKEIWRKSARFVVLILKFSFNEIFLKDVLFEVRLTLSFSFNNRCHNVKNCWNYFRHWKWNLKLTFDDLRHAHQQIFNSLSFLIFISLLKLK